MANELTVLNQTWLLKEGKTQHFSTESIWKKIKGKEQITGS